MLEENRSNYIAALSLSGKKGGAAFCELTTGEMCCASFETDAVSHLINELGRFSPREVLLSPEAADNKRILAFLSEKLSAMPETGEERFRFTASSARLCAQFGWQALEESGLEDAQDAVCAAGALLSYLDETQKFDLSHVNRLDVFSGGRYMEMDWTTRRNLELTESLRSGEKRGSLLWVLDKTKTAMGARRLRSFLEQPLLDKEEILARQEAVEELNGAIIDREELREYLGPIYDLERLIGRLAFGSASPRDLIALKLSLRMIPPIKSVLGLKHSARLTQLNGALDPLEDMTDLLERAIAEDPPLTVREGGIIKPGYSEENDRLHLASTEGKTWLLDLETQERERTGIKNLKIKYNKVFGYYFEVTNSFKDLVPADFIRKQTLVGAERYTTPRLKELEDVIVGAQDKSVALEYELFTDVRNTLVGETPRLKRTAQAVAALDALVSLALVADRNRYVRPQINDKGVLNIKEGRHPVVEQMLEGDSFIANDTYLDSGDHRLSIITGPNMAGKSTYMRQTALIVLMAQMGSFVPAKSALVGIVDRVFTRIGASDDLASGQSTFMVEMNEMANILSHATASSLLILDEIGRGTSTFDGMAIARAVLEYCADKRRLGAKTMFATHYHELSALEGEIAGVRNYNITAKKQGGTLVFLRKIVPGAADESYGIEVAKLAGLPDGIIGKAKGYLRELTEGGTAALGGGGKKSADGQISLGELGGDEVREILAKTDLNTLTPIEAMNLLFELQRKARG